MCCWYLAPVAIIALESIITYESGSYTIPDIEPTIFNLDGTLASVDDHYREMFFDNGLRTLHNLRDKIFEILEAHHITVIPQEEMDKPAQWLRFWEDAFVGEEAMGRKITLRDAFFFRGP